MRLFTWFCCVSVVGSLALAGCTGSDSQSANGERSVERSDVVGHWKSDSPSDERSFAQHVTFTADGTWTGSLDGCNTQNGKWVFDTSSRSVAFEDVASTLIGCVNPKTGDASTTADTADVTSSKLTLLDGGANVGKLTKVNSTD